MIFVSKPSVSTYLAKSIFELQIPVVLTEDVKIPLKPSLKILSLEEIKRNPRMAYSSNMLTSSENALNALYNTIPHDERVMKSALFKDKARFRRAIANDFPDFKFKEVSIKSIDSVDASQLFYPLILKPSTGVSSIGVIRVDTSKEWKEAISFLKKELNSYSSNYTKSVVETENVIMEQYIDGVELAIDGYFARDGEPVVLNILQHVFADHQDTSDRIYFTRRSIVRKYLNRIQLFLEKFSNTFDLKNYPFHLEVRCAPDGRIVPIELNPLRFAGLGTTEVAEFAYGINVYKHYFGATKPDWEKVLSNEDDSYFAFFCADVPTSHFKKEGLSILDRKFAGVFSELLEYRILDETETSTFAVLFFRTDSESEIQSLLRMDMLQFMSL